MEKEKLTIHSPFLVQPQQLRKRQERKTYCFSRKNIKCKQKLNQQHNNYSQITSLNQSLNTSTLKNHRNINWLKYNILVGIYENWLRLYPLIQHLLQRFPQAHKSISQSIVKFDYLKKKKHIKPQKNENNSDLLKGLIENIKLRRLQILQKVTEIQDNEVDGQIIKFVNHMAQKLLSTLSIQNTMWNKIRIQKHNRLIDQALNKFSENQFAVNSSAILQSLKERLEFITKIQDSYIDAVNYDPKYKDKLVSLKQTFQKGFITGSGSTIQQKLKIAWNQLKNDRSNKRKLSNKNKKNNKSNQRYTVFTRIGSNSLIIKYKHRKNDFFNEAYIRSKMKLSKKKKQNKQNQNAQNEDILSKNTDQPVGSSIFIKQVQNSSRYSSSDQNQSLGKELKKQQLEIIDSYLKKTRKRIKKENLSSMFNSSKINQNQSLARPSISYFQQPKLLKQNQNRKSLSLQGENVLKTQKNTSRGSKSSKHRPSIQNLFDEVREDHLSRFKSQKKILTTKHQKGVNSKARVTKETKSNFNYRDSKSKFQKSQENLEKKIAKRQFFRSNRKGNLLRKGVLRKAFQQQSLFDQILSTENGYFSHKRDEIIAYFIMIKQSGLLKQQKYSYLNERISQLLSKHSLVIKAANREFVQKLCQKSIKSDYYELPDELLKRNQERREIILKQLSSMIGKDERVQIKIKQEMKIYQDQKVEHCSSQGQSGNQQYIMNKVEIGDFQQQIKRLLQFQQQNKTISLGNIFKNRYNKLEQKKLF